MRVVQRNCWSITWFIYHSMYIHTHIYRPLQWHLGLSDNKRYSYIDRCTLADMHAFSFFKFVPSLSLTSSSINNGADWREYRLFIFLFYFWWSASRTPFSLWTGIVEGRRPNSSKQFTQAHTERQAASLVTLQRASYRCTASQYINGHYSSQKNIYINGHDSVKKLLFLSYVKFVF